MTTKSDGLDGVAARTRARLGEILDGIGPRVEPRLLEAMRYALLSSGKAVRPALVLGAEEAAGSSSMKSLDWACAVEMVHAYSLVHDDLPAMDDDPVRRGKPATHVAFGEGIAILVGDALLTEAFGVVAAAEGLPPEARVAAARELAEAAGARGMAGGQAADLLEEHCDATPERVESIHTRKTGALFRCAVRLGGLAAGAGAEQMAALTRFGELFGLGFQVADDILDRTAAPEVTGKSGPADEERGKSTTVSARGLDGARRRLEDLLEETRSALAPLGGSSRRLEEVAAGVLGRALDS